MTGSRFSPGVAFAHRIKGAPENGAPDVSHFWRQPNIYFGDYLEIASSNDPLALLSWRGFEFCVRSPEGNASSWVELTYDFDDDKLLADMRRLRQEGESLLEEGRSSEAVVTLNRASIIARGLFGWNSAEHAELDKLHNRSIGEKALSKLRFREGARLRVTAGPHQGKSGPVTRLLLRHHHAYLIDDGADGIPAADDQVEEIS